MMGINCFRKFIGFVFVIETHVNVLSVT